MGIFRKLFGRDKESKKSQTINSRNSTANYSPDAGIEYYRKIRGITEEEITLRSVGHARVQVGETNVGTMIIFNTNNSHGEFCLSVIVPESASEMRARLSNPDDTLIVKGHLSSEDYFDGNGVPYCPIIGTVTVG